MWPKYHQWGATILVSSFKSGWGEGGMLREDTLVQIATNHKVGDVQLSNIAIKISKPQGFHLLVVPIH